MTRLLVSHIHLKSYTWNLLLTEFSKRFQRLLFSPPMICWQNCWKVDLFHTDINPLFKWRHSHCYFSYAENPAPINQIHEKQIFLQITILKPPYQIWRFKVMKRCLPDLFDETFSLTLSYQRSSQYSKLCDWLVTFQNLSIHLSKKQTNKILPWSLQVAKVIGWKVFTVLSSLSNS